MNKLLVLALFATSTLGGALVYGCSDSGGGGGTTDAGGDGGGCTVGGKTYKIGESFKADCNSCTCTAEGASCTTMACLDGGVPDIGAVDANDFGSFKYNWYGTGVSSSFMLDRDCGIATTATGSGKPPTSGTGVVAETDCKKFEQLVTSPAVITALSDKAPKCSDMTDDNSTWTLGLQSGGVISRTASGCSSVAPFNEVKSEIGRLTETYSKPVPADAGPADASGD